MFLIPTERVSKAEKLIDKLTKSNLVNKADVQISDINHYLENKDEENTYYECKEVKVDINYSEGEWEFIAALEHTEHGNIIRKAISDVVLPDEYYTCKPICDHCQKERLRRDTFIVRNKNGEFKQVGSTCVKEYTKTLDGTNCQEIANTLKKIEDLADVREFKSSSTYINNRVFKLFVYPIIKSNGYVKDKTFRLIQEKLLEKGAFDNLQDNPILDEIDNWVDTLDTSRNDYYRNASIAWKLSYIQPRHYALIASLVNTYIKDSQKCKQSATLIGKNVGDKVIVNIAEYRVIYVKGAYAYGADPSIVYRIVDKDGLVYIWSTTKDLEHVKTIEATIKEFNKYNDEEQIVITRGKRVELEDTAAAFDKLIQCINDDEKD